MQLESVRDTCRAIYGLYVAGRPMAKAVEFLISSKRSGEFETTCQPNLYLLIFRTKTSQRFVNVHRWSEI